jgi:hypothetical protein
VESTQNTVRPPSTYSRPQISPNSRVWNLACLRGSAAGYLRGTVTLLRVRTWVHRALRAGASAEEVRTTLNPFDLVLDTELNVAVRAD